MIGASDRIHSVLARDESLLEVLVRVSPTFEKLRSGALRQTMGRLLTVEQAARIAGIDPQSLLAQLNGALSPDAPPAQPEPPVPVASPPPTTVPADLLAIPADRVVDADVRDELRAGREPFPQILAAARATPEDGVLRVRAIFEPAPLYGVLAKQGFTHFTERLAADDWRVWFRRGAVPAPATVPAEAPDADGDVVILDVRGLEPPEPMIRTMEALEALPPHKTLLQLNVRVPQFLLPKIQERGFTYEVREQSEDLVRIFIRHARRP